MLFHYSAIDFVTKFCYNYTHIITNKVFHECKNKIIIFKKLIKTTSIGYFIICK